MHTESERGPVACADGYELLVSALATAWGDGLSEVVVDGKRLREVAPNKGAKLLPRADKARL